MISVYLKAIAIIAPGLQNWDKARRVFNHQETYTPQRVDKKLDTLLPANENRRASRTTQLALSAVQQLLREYPFDSQTVRYVFTSCNGDLSVFDQISSALILPGRPVSPIKFHNSVHNAPAGYCAIALSSESPSTSIAAWEDSFANGLLEAAVQSFSAQQDCLLSGYDEIPPEPLLSVVPIEDDFSCALLLSPHADRSLCRLDLSLTTEQQISRMENRQLERLRKSNPQARVLPLLYSIARRQENTIILAYNQLMLEVKVSNFFYPEGTHE